jgi:hypothetical protein
LKTLFKVGRDKGASDTLLLELGQDYCCYGFLDQEAKTFHQIRYISFEEREAEDKLAIVFDELKNEDLPNIIICAAYSQALLVPGMKFSNDTTLLNMVYDTPVQKQFHDQIEEWQMVAVYGFPDTVQKLIQANFPFARTFHAYTPALKIYNGYMAADQIDLHFTTQDFRVLVKKDQQVLLAQTYQYKTPLDVVYYLLKISCEFGLDQSSTFLIVSGLIEKDSALYQELHNYFVQLHFAQATTYELPENSHPHYYFTSLYNLASCVS